MSETRLQLMLMMLAFLADVRNKTAADAHDAGLPGRSPTNKTAADAHDACVSGRSPQTRLQLMLMMLAFLADPQKQDCS